MSPQKPTLCGSAMQACGEACGGWVWFFWLEILEGQSVQNFTGGAYRNVYVVRTEFTWVTLLM